MAKPGRQSFDKRLREKKKQEKRQEKEQRRAERKIEKENTPEEEGSDIVDLSSIVPTLVARPDDEQAENETAAPPDGE